MTQKQDPGVCVSCANPGDNHRSDCKEVARLAEGKKKGNGCGECGGTGKIAKTTRRGRSITFGSTKCPTCKGKGATKREVDLTGLVELLAGKRMDGTPIP